MIEDEIKYCIFKVRNIKIMMNVKNMNQLVDNFCKNLKIKEKY